MRPLQHSDGSIQGQYAARHGYRNKLIKDDYDSYEVAHDTFKNEKSPKEESKKPINQLLKQKSPQLISQVSEEVKDAHKPMHVQKNSLSDFENSMYDKRLLDRPQLDSEPLQRKGMDIHYQAKLMSHRQSRELKQRQSSIDRSLCKFKRDQQEKLVNRKENGVVDHHFSSKYRGPGYDDKADLSYSSSPYEESVWKERDEAPVMYSDIMRQRHQQKQISEMEEAKV